MSLVKNKDDKKSKLTSRQKSIIQILTKFTAANPVTIATISEQLNLSSRTILREMPKIEQWLSDNNFKFVRKPGVGLVLDENLENQKIILELLELENVEKSYSKEERRKYILIELLSTKEPLKSFYFTSKFKISEGTLSSDFDFIEKWLKNYNLSILRKQGLGVYIRGSESGYRQAIANALYEFMTEADIIRLLNNTKNEHSKVEISNQKKLFNLIDDKTMKIVEKILIDTEKKMQIKYTDSAYMGLIVHISLAIKRIQNCEKIQMEPEKLAKLEMMPEFSVAEEIGRAIEEKMNISIPKDEIGFITMHHVSAKIWITQDENNFCSYNNINIKNLVLMLVMFMEKELNMYLRDDPVLIEDLCNHIPPVLSRMVMNVSIKNSQLKTIKDTYKNVFNATARSCEVLKNSVGVNRISEAEIAFIAMHFCVAIEKKLSAENMFSVVVVCPTGLGSSRMLATNIAKFFHNIKVTDIISAININIDELSNNGVDFIISTINLDIDFPYVCVNPILLEQDKALINNKLNSIEKNKASKKVQYSNKKVFDVNDVLYISNLSEQILNVLNSIRLYVVSNVKNIEQIFDIASGLFAQEERNKNVIKEDLKRRELLAETYIPNFNIMLMHCKTSAVSQCCFGYIRLKYPLKQDNKLIRGAVVMLIPDKDNRVHADVISQISSAIVENESFFEAMLYKEKDEISKELEKSLLIFYKRTLKKRMEC